MNPIERTFQQFRQNGKTLLIPYITVGDPDLDTSVEIIRELETAGAAMIELGVPYSDPLADGPVIQRASARALKHRITILDCIRAAKLARERGVTLPFILFSYYNPVLQLGMERFFQLLLENGIDGIIIPDLPVEESAELRTWTERTGISCIPLVAPTSNDRIRSIVSRATGFVYCVSSLGVTGMRSHFSESIDAFLKTVKNASALPVCVGFGISNREQVKRFSAIADGVIVGSALVQKIEQVLPLLGDEREKPKALLQIREFVRELIGNEN